MSHPIFMNWVNQTGDTFSFTNVNVQGRHSAVGDRGTR